MSINTHTFVNITKLADLFVKKLAKLEVCPDCGGAGHESRDYYSESRGHYTKETPCETCDGSGEIGEDDEYEPSSEEISKQKQDETNRVAEMKMLQRLGLCLACKGTGKFLAGKNTEKICPLCGGSGKESKPKPKPFPKIKNPYWTPPGY